MSSPRGKILALTPGDPAGIGPEITWKALLSGSYRQRGVSLLCVGAREPFEKLGAPIIVANPEESLTPPRTRSPHIWLLPAPKKTPRPGLLLAGYQTGWAIERATELVKSGLADALVTGPLHKDRLQKGGFLFPGHTEFLAKLCGVRQVTMMLANDQLRISLVTIHLSLQDVSSAITGARIRRTVEDTARHLRLWWGISRPKLAVCALNPHGGESGLFGREEIRIISPTLQNLVRQARGRYSITGPLPSDTLFARHFLAPAKEKFDAIVCMYHDQGLIPVKLLDFHRTVNVTLGLPIVRTSVDHGVGFDIVGTGKANPSSLQSAIDLAIEITQKRRRK